MSRAIPNPDGGRPIPPPMCLDKQSAEAVRLAAIRRLKFRSDKGDPVLSVWSQYEASVALIDEMAGGRG